MKYIALLLLIFISFSCSRGYFNTVQSYYDYEEAYQLVHGLKDGTLIVQIPCNKRKKEIFKNLYEKEEDIERKAELKNDYDQITYQLQRNQKSLLNGIIKYYNFSQYVFIPDTLLRDFKNGKRENIFLKPNLTFEPNIDVDTTKTIMILRDFRDYDDLYIYKIDGSIPPNPFPYASTVPTGGINVLAANVIEKSEENMDVHEAIYTINARLKNFHNHYKGPR